MTGFHLLSDKAKKGVRSNRHDEINPFGRTSDSHSAYSVI